MLVACWWPLTFVLKAAVSSSEGPSGVSQQMKAKGRGAEKDGVFYQLMKLSSQPWCPHFAEC